MANIKSAIKRIDVANRNNERNKAMKTEVKSSIKKFEQALNAGNIDEARELLKLIDKKLKKAAHKNIIHQNAASRKMSRLTLKLNKVG
ncbi:small subunit ribosomal protein S20 [Anaerosphaera aminiphila DSM 21120]|uniref:Small ribosomal subunit protein bS20 n=1 Tax=Anaerosphaera aminiphila DSM 21120 TaxID=1120995 RepID=A0A1M5RLF5_9FIRM|nr:30S ribosomal protein S20 [Anaerosphaera aminiphila]SHH27009.1 small subunit ribosomal protein S20 [Anaerosphaera aminiphila DSM 21120]